MDFDVWNELIICNEGLIKQFINFKYFNVKYLFLNIYECTKIYYYYY